MKNLIWVEYLVIGILILILIMGVSSVYNSCKKPDSSGIPLEVYQSIDSMNKANAKLEIANAILSKEKEGLIKEKHISDSLIADYKQQLTQIQPSYVKIIQQYKSADKPTQASMFKKQWEKYQAEMNNEK